MQVYQIRIKLFTLKDIHADKMQEKLTVWIDTGFAGSEELLQMHEKNCFKNYCYDMPYKIERDKIYKREHIYTVTIRTIDPKLADYFYKIYANHFTDDLKGLVADVRILPKKMIGCLYTLTPAILKDDRGYWKKYMKLEQYEERLKVNLIKKWNSFTGEQINEDFQFYTLIEFLNTLPIGVNYKNIKLLGDKLRIQVADNETAQRIAYMTLGTGLLEMNSRGAGFVNYRWI